MTDHATYHEHIVGCTYVPCGEDLVLVLPASTNGHVRERIVRCRHCRFRMERASGAMECAVRPLSRHYTEPDGYCHLGEPE